MVNEIAQVSAAVAEAEKELGLDWRDSYSHIGVGDGDVIEVELSRSEVFDRVVGLLGSYAIESKLADIVRLRSSEKIPIRLRLLVPASRGALLWVVTSVADIRRAPAHESELLTQMIMGETTAPLKTEGDWHLVRLSDDYHGWVRSWYVRETRIEEIETYTQGVNALVDANVSYILSEPDEESLPISDAVSGTHLVVLDEVKGFQHVVLPGGREGYVRSGDLAAPRSGDAPDRARLVRRAERYLGITYLWGGTSAKGFDCSGLVKRVFLEEGIALPRDTDRQSLVGRKIARSRLARFEPADLLFFGEKNTISHVAIYVGNKRFIHSYGEVRINSIDEGDPLYEEKLAKILQFGRSILG